MNQEKAPEAGMSRVVKTAGEVEPCKLKVNLKLKKSWFSQNEICHANEFSGVVLFKYSSVLGLCFSSILVFLETHDCIRRLCFNARAAVRNEREVLEENHFFSNCVYQITEFSEVVIFKLSCVLRIP